jgi:hypothetical protein
MHEMQSPTDVVGPSLAHREGPPVTLSVRQTGGYCCQRKFIFPNIIRHPPPPPPSLTIQAKG